MNKGCVKEQITVLGLPADAVEITFLLLPQREGSWVIYPPIAKHHLLEAAPGASTPEACQQKPLGRGFQETLGSVHRGRWVPRMYVERAPRTPTHKAPLGNLILDEHS